MGADRIDVLAILRGAIDHSNEFHQQAVAAVAELIEESALLMSGVANLGNDLAKALHIARLAAAHFGTDHRIGRDAIELLESISGGTFKVPDDFISARGGAA